MSFEALALPAIQPGNPATRLVVIDELGRMELFSASFYPAVQQVLDNPQLLVFGSVLHHAAAGPSLRWTR
ncbi:hypothetical protein COO60DRAFT_1634334 [Scenedesmus sp. NREL 46B-D3]|nr:hypothetical protein COO60DRAFT_1634334 [Scenedesmus sp. NREL 46B-D3]